MTAKWDQPLPEIAANRQPLFTKNLKHRNSHQAMRFEAGQALDSVYQMGEPFLECASDFLNVYRRHKRNYTVGEPARCRNFELFPEWVFAAQLFCR